jgi:hypothetical protein
MVLAPSDLALSAHWSHAVALGSNRVTPGYLGAYFTGSSVTLAVALAPFGPGLLWTASPSRAISTVCARVLPAHERSYRIEFVVRSTLTGRRKTRDASSQFL